jgi:uncharacterized protein YecE (DUF72 family)
MSGWVYPPWRGGFYPAGITQKNELEYASRAVSSIEINGSFYSLQRPSSYQRWKAETPPGFVFSLKGSRFITHIKKLRGVETAVAGFLASGVLCLGEKLGPILWQFPERFPAELDRFADFLALLPRTMDAAAEMSRHHDAKLDGRAWTEAEVSGPLRHAVEIRSPGLLGPEFVALLRQHGVALVIGDSGGRWPFAEDVTADFLYLRLHGPGEERGYSDAELDYWAARIGQWRRGGEPADATRLLPPAPGGGSRDVFVYSDNDFKVQAPFDAMRLRERLDADTGPD